MLPSKMDMNKISSKIEDNDQAATQWLNLFLELHVQILDHCCIQSESTLSTDVPRMRNVDRVQSMRKFVVFGQRWLNLNSKWCKQCTQQALFPRLSKVIFKV